MAKVTEEMIRLDTQRSAAEVKAKVAELLARAKSPSARAAVNNILNELESAPVSNSLRALEVDRRVRAVLTEYETECMQSGNSDIDEGTCKILSKIFGVRAALSNMSVGTDKRAAFKAYRKKYPSLAKRDLKKNFEEEFALSGAQEKSYDHQITILGKLAKSYSLENMELKKKAQLSDITAQIKALKEKFKASKDERERERLNGEYRKLLSEKEECDVSLARTLNAKRNISSTQQLLEEYHNQAKIAKIDDTSEDEIEKLVGALTTANRKETTRNNNINKAMEDYSASRENYMRSTAKFHAENSLEAEIERDRARELDSISVSGGGVKAASLEDLDIDLEEGI